MSHRHSCRWFWTQSLLTAALVGCTFALLSASVYAADAYSLDKNIDADGLAFGSTDAFAFGVFASDDQASFKGNDILVQTQTPGSGNDGAGVSIPISNGENGYTETFDTLNTPNDTSNPDINNATPPNSAWATIGNSIPPANAFPPNPVTGTPNPRVGLNNGNVLRYSMWVREDPNNPITIAPSVEPVFKFEFYKEALSTFADNNGNGLATFADKVYDTDQYGQAGVWIDLDGNGTVSDPSASVGNGRVKSISSTDWTLIEVTYEVDDTEWFGIDDDLYTVADIEEIRAVMFWGDFDGSNGEAGSLWFDNARVEVFKDASSVTANTNPNPTLDELTADPDFNNDTFVNGADFLTWQRGFGVGTEQFEGDANFSGNVDGADLAIWQNLYGTVIPNGVGAASSVPEPASAALVVLGWIGLAGFRRRLR